MNLKKLKLASLVATIFLPTLLSLMVLVKPSEVYGATGNVALLCKNTAGKISWPASTGKCASTDVSIVPNSLPADFTALCLAATLGKPDSIFNAVTTSGQISCDKYKSDPYYDADLINRDQVLGTPPVTATPPIKNPPVTPGTNSNPKGPTGSTSGSTSKVNDIGGCPEGFTSKGPLCIPNNPFGNSEGIVGKGTLGELAATIISILLGMAGIVAVIFVIIGGYQFMTARGNETQSTEGRKTVVNALIGLAIIIVSYAVVQAVTNYLTTGK